MSHENRIEQLEDLKNVETNADFYEKLAAGKIATSHSGAASLSSANGKGLAQPYYIPVPITIKSQLGSPTALAIGAFATTLSTLGMALMGFRGVGVTNAFIGNFFGVAGIGMVSISNHSEPEGLPINQCHSSSPPTGNSCSGIPTRTPCLQLLDSSMQVLASSLLLSSELRNRTGVPIRLNTTMLLASGCSVSLFSLNHSILRLTISPVWAVWNLFFLLGSLPLNLVYIAIFATVQAAFTLVAAGYFLAADGAVETAKAVNTAAGAFAFASGMLGYYTVANLMCSEALFFSFPMGDTSRFFRRKPKVE